MKLDILTFMDVNTVLYTHVFVTSPHVGASSRKGYGHSVIFLAYFLTMLSSPKMKRDLLTVKQFSRTGMGLYKAMVRARCALVCLKAGEMPPVDTAAPSRFLLRSEPPSPELNRAGTSSPNRAILSTGSHTGRDSETVRQRDRETETGKRGYSLPESRARCAARSRAVLFNQIQTL